MEIIPKGTRLYRAIDSAPDRIDSPLKVNAEGVLWCAADSSTAATYIPAWGLLGGLGMPYRNLDDSVSPGDDVMQALIRQCGGKFTIHDREISVPLDELKDPPNDTIYRDGVAKMGRPTSWSMEPRITWREIVGEMERLGYGSKADSGFCWLKMGRDSEGRVAVVPADSQYQGALIIMETTQDMLGSDRQHGDLLDPDYHHAARFAREEADQDFFTINDYCQTQKWGNVGHVSHAILPNGLAKLKVLAVLPAVHNDWEKDILPHTNPCPEEKEWQKAQQLIALPPVPDLRHIPSPASPQVDAGRYR